MSIFTAWKLKLIFMSQLRKTILEIHRNISKKGGVSNINAGGCPWFAFFTALECERYGIPYNIEVMSGQWDDNEVDDKLYIINNKLYSMRKRMMLFLFLIVG